MIGENTKKWIVKAMEDYRIAGHELTFPDEDIATSPVCFHCQQVTEKLLKAYLIAKHIDFEKTHDLEHLLELCIEQEIEFKNLDVGNLTSYAVEARYPDEFYIPSVEEAKKCFEIASRVKNFIFKKLNIHNSKDLMEENKK